MKALIILPKTSRYSPSKLGNFLWNDEHQAHLYGGKPLDMEEFNAISKRIFFERRDEIEDFDLPPYVQMIASPVKAKKVKPAGDLKSKLTTPAKSTKVPLVPISLP